MAASSTISSKGQITVPIEVRRRLGVKQGDRVEFVEEDGKTILRPVRPAARRRKAIQESPRRLLADFLIGSHALVHADRLMTFDTNRFTHDFPELPLIGASIQ